MSSIETLSGRAEFLELTKGQGVFDVLRVSSDTIHILLCRDLWPEEMKVIRQAAHEWWSFDRIILAVHSDLGGLVETKRAG